MTSKYLRSSIIFQSVRHVLGANHSQDKSQDLDIAFEQTF